MEYSFKIKKNEYKNHVVWLVVFVIFHAPLRL